MGHHIRYGYTYIVSNFNRTTLYVGATRDIYRRMLEHKSGYGSTFTSRYNLFHLLYYEQIVGVKKAFARERQLKNWHCDWKWNLIKAVNPELQDIAQDWYTPEEVDTYVKLRKSLGEDYPQRA